MGILKEDGVEIIEQKFEQDCLIKVFVRTGILERIMKSLEKIEAVKIKTHEIKNGISERTV